MNAPLINRGVYTVADAARLLRGSPQKIRGWISGYPRTHAEPILKNDIGWLDDSLAFSFANLMELRFIQYFAGMKVSVKAIRGMAREAERLLNHPHPFATKTIFQTDGRKIFARIADETQDPKLYDLRDKNWAMLDIIAQSLHVGVSYNPAGDAASWRPRAEYPDIIVHPAIAFGQPVLRNEGIPTRAIFESFQAEKDSVDNVAKWFGVTPNLVTDAVGFQVNLSMAT